jgi:hypothetical protein
VIHPSGIGLWAVALRGIGWPVFVPGHTAHEAWQAAAFKLGWPGFDECTFILLSDHVAVPKAEPAPAPRRRRRKLRLVGAHP